MPGGACMERSLELTLFFLSEAIIIGLFYVVSQSEVFFYLYLSVTPVLFAVLSYYLLDIRAVIQKVLLSRDLIVFAAIFVLWLYLYAVTRNGPSYVIETAYFPAFLEEFNFRFIVIRFLARYAGEGRAIIVQALLYTVAYGSYLVFAPAGYRGAYALLFVLDNFAMSCFYGAIYYLRKNVYFDLSIHMSLYLMDVFLPASLGWLAYTFTPV